MDAYELINKSYNLLNKLISKGYFNFRVTDLSKDLFETLKIIGNCTSCKKDNIKEKDFNEFHELINEIAFEEEEEEMDNVIDSLGCKIIEIDDELNRKVL